MHQIDKTLICCKSYLISLSIGSVKVLLLFGNGLFRRALGSVYIGSCRRVSTASAVKELCVSGFFWPVAACALFCALSRQPGAAGCRRTGSRRHVTVRVRSFCRPSVPRVERPLRWGGGAQPVGGVGQDIQFFFFWLLIKQTKPESVQMLLSFSVLVVVALFVLWLARVEAAWVLFLSLFAVFVGCSGFTLRQIGDIWGVVILHNPDPTQKSGLRCHGNNSRT